MIDPKQYKRHRTKRSQLHPQNQQVSKVGPDYRTQTRYPAFIELAFVIFTKHRQHKIVDSRTY